VDDEEYEAPRGAGHRGGLDGRRRRVRGRLPADLLGGEPVGQRLATESARDAFAVTVAGDWEGLPNRDDLAMPAGTLIR